MIKFLRRFLGLEKDLLLLEVSPEIPFGQEGRDACVSLGNHPGFQFLCQQLRRHKALIKSTLEICEAKDLIRLQEKLKAVTWLERYVAAETKTKAVQKREVTLSDHDKTILANSLASVSVVE